MSWSRRRDRRLHVLRGRVDIALEVELNGDRRRAERAERRHLRDAGDLPDLTFERRRDRRSHSVRAGARKRSSDLNRREVDLRERCNRQKQERSRFPTNANATISSVVATGRLMNGSERFTCPSPLRPICGAVTLTETAALQPELSVSYNTLTLPTGPT